MEMEKLIRAGLPKLFRAFTFILFFCASFTKVEALVYKFEGSLDDFSAKYLADGFGFATGGQVQIDMVVNTIIDTTTDSWYWDRPKAYILVLNSDQIDNWYENMYSSAKSGKNEILCTSPAVTRYELVESSSHTFTVPTSDKYTVILAYCDSQERPMDVAVTARLVNLNTSGNLAQHLPIQLAMLPTLYLTFGLGYLGLAAVWAWECKEQRPHLTRIHRFFTATLFFKLVAMFANHFYYAAYGRAGAVPHALAVFRNLCLAAALGAFLLALLLLALGYAVNRPTRGLRGREGRALGGAFTLYAALAAALAGCGNRQNDTDLCRAFLLAEYVARSMLMLFIIVAANFNIHHLRLGLASSPWSAGLALTYRHLADYTRFRWAFIAYLLLPTALLVVQMTLLTWEYDWCAPLAEEAFLVLLYCHAGATFAPGDPAAAARPFDGSLADGAGQAVPPEGGGGGGTGGGGAAEGGAGAGSGAD